MIVYSLRHLYKLAFVAAMLSFRAAFVHPTNTKSNGTIRCLANERAALLKFKDELIDDSGRLSSWGGKRDCCTWSGIHCHNQANNVIKMNLRIPKPGSPPLKGMISPWLLEMEHLEYLDLSGNDFNYSRIPQFIGSLRRLQHLDLSFSNFSGPIPHHLGNLSKLQFLGLGGGIYIQSSSTNLDWVSRLHSLRYLRMSFVNLAMATNWYQAINKLTQLEKLDLEFCNLHMLPIPSSFVFNASNSLSYLDLQGNELSSSFFPWLFNFSTASLRYLELGFNNLQGSVPDAIGNLMSLSYLSFAGNRLEGKLPIFLGNLSSLLHLELRDNNLTGIVPQSTIGRLSKLEYLSLEFNHLCIGTNVSLSGRYMDLSNNSFSGELPECLANLPPLESLNLAHNNFSGTIPSLNIISSLHLQNNSFTGEIPISLRNSTFLTFLDLSENNLSGELPTWVGDTWTQLLFLSLRSNEFTGTIPSTLCHLELVQVLDLSLNKISGHIPKCLSNLTAFTKEVYHGIDFGDLFGGIKSAFLMWKGVERQYISSPLRLVKLIDLSSNNLVGDIPAEITSLVTLVGLNLSRNNLSGFVPTKLGGLRSLDLLDLSRNHIDGGIPNSISQLDQLGALDLSCNNLSGEIPQSNHLQTFNASSFEGNPGLCGLPLLKACRRDEIGQDSKIFGMKIPKKEDGLLGEGFYISLAFGFIFGFWGVLATLYFNESWRTTFFEFWNTSIDWWYVKIAISRIRIREAFYKFTTG